MSGVTCGGLLNLLNERENCPQQRRPSCAGARDSDQARHFLLVLLQCFIIHGVYPLVGLLGGVLWANLSVGVESLSLRRSSDSSVGSGSDSDDSGVDSTRHTVVQLVVQLWQSVLRVHRGLGQVSDGSGLNHVSDGDSLDGLVLWHTSGTVQTSDWLDVTSALLVSTVGSSLLWHVAGVSTLDGGLDWWIEGDLDWRRWCEGVQRGINQFYGVRTYL